MRAFEFTDEYQFTYPTEMEFIITHLESWGKINVSPKRLEELYEDFSTDVYCARWRVADKEIVEYFAEWLARKEV